MLLELHIRNFALIDSIDLEFYKGLNILTGETGAGKSILIDSVNFILGEKQSKDIIRIGQNSAFAEAVFDIENNKLIAEMLFNSGIINDNSEIEDNILIISREINKNGRSISRVNGRTITISVLKTLSKLLIDIHGQHEHQSLFDENSHIQILDSFCGIDFLKVNEKYFETYCRLKEIDRELQDLRTDEQSKLRKIDLLKFQIQEISEVKLVDEEDEELKKRKDILVNSEKIFSALNYCFQNLHENDIEESAYDKIGTSITNLDNIEKYDNTIKDLNIMLKDVYFKLEDIVENIRNYKDNIEFDQHELDDIEVRLDVINRLKRKYGNSIKGILEYFEEIKAELELIEKSDENIEKLTSERKGLLDEVNIIAAKLTEIRINTAKILKLDIEKELKHLGMEKAVFQIQIAETDIYFENGKNKVAFNISANPGEPPKPLVKVASGGEMSRIMLAIKSVIANVDKIPTLIFDEIDTGISGRTAQAVAEKMCMISRTHQLLCVTHLPQIAAMADNHFKIEKNVNIKEEKTTTSVKILTTLDRIEELSRMLGGAEVTALTKEHANEMIKLADKTKNKI
jgi:DNA repair protein RecN (Recombination protein N)